MTSSSTLRKTEPESKTLDRYRHVDDLVLALAGHGYTFVPLDDSEGDVTPTAGPRYLMPRNVCPDCKECFVSVEILPFHVSDGIWGDQFAVGVSVSSDGSLFRWETCDAGEGSIQPISEQLLGTLHLADLSTFLLARYGLEDV